jgi:hypothetical protein
MLTGKVLDDDPQPGIAGRCAGWSSGWASR